MMKNIVVIAVLCISHVTIAQAGPAVIVYNENNINGGGSSNFANLPDGGCGAGFTAADGGYWFADCAGDTYQTGNVYAGTPNNGTAANGVFISRENPFTGNYWNFTCDNGNVGCTFGSSLTDFNNNISTGPGLVRILLSEYTDAGPTASGHATIIAGETSDLIFAVGEGPTDGGFIIRESSNVLSDYTYGLLAGGQRVVAKLNVTPVNGAAGCAGTGTLVSGTKAVTTACVTANSLVFITDVSASETNVGALTVSAKSAGVSFTVSSTSALDTSTFNWFIVN